MAPGTLIGANPCRAAWHFCLGSSTSSQGSEDWLCFLCVAVLQPLPELNPCVICSTFSLHWGLWSGLTETLLIPHS